MRIEKIRIYQVRLPFKGIFPISRLQGRSSEHAVVEVIAERAKSKGYGESVPIKFVTGETPAGTVEDARRFVTSDAFPWQLDDVSQIWGFVNGLPRDKGHNAAVCAIELALLDALGRDQNRSILAYFPKDFYTDRIHYGASITLGDEKRVREICALVRDLGIRRLRIRIKMDKDLEQNRDALETVRAEFGEECELRIDPNGVWDRELAFKHMPLVREYGVKIVEEPMVRDCPGFDEFAETLRANNVILMACESAPTIEDIRRIVDEGHYQMVNVKLSRSGGFRRSLKIIDCLRQNGLAFQIGCTLGEGGILSAAGRVLGLLCKDAVTYDGSYDRFLLQENFTVEDVSFGPGGEAGPLGGPGLGVAVRSDSLTRLADGNAPVTITRP
jgi:L-alanine-DL-glutamate epimerase-like enolase superfamily enzyme